VCAALLGGCATAAPTTLPPTDAPRASSDRCGERGAAVQVLGSGGPVPDAARASSGYLLWRDGVALALIDAGGGTFARFGEVGARLDDLELLAVSHLHTDHAAELPAFLKALHFSDRAGTLPLYGPSGGGGFPALPEFLHALFASDGGAFPYLAWLLEGGRALQLRAVTLDASEDSPQVVHRGRGWQLSYVGVTHGPVPALAFRAEFAGPNGRLAVVLAGDQAGDDASLLALSRGADVLIAHLAVPERADPVAARLHALPSELAELARDAGVGTLVLSHLMARTRAPEAAAEARHAIAARFPGPTIVATDRLCIPIAPVTGTSTERPSPTVGRGAGERDAR
jgi:ribonuclease BN (tRNA processing enzyme)